MSVSDWPPNPKWFRTPHWDTECRCRNFFPAGLEPPPFWFFPGVAQTSSFWKFLEKPRYLRPLTYLDPGCGWYWGVLDLLNQEAYQIQLFVDEVPPYPVIRFRLVVESTNLPRFWRFHHDGAQPVSLLANPQPRGTEYSWPDETGWYNENPLGVGEMPIGLFSLVPVPCLPDWSWNEDIPLWEL